MLSSSLALKAHWKVFRNRDSSVLPRLVIPKIMSDKNSVDVLIPAQARVLSLWPAASHADKGGASNPYSCNSSELSTFEIGLRRLCYMLVVS
jgi:hypothetical protein